MSYSEFLQMLGVGDSPAMQQAYMGFTSPEGLPGQIPGPAATSQLGFEGSPIESGAGADPEGYELASQPFYAENDPELYSTIPAQSNLAPSPVMTGASGMPSADATAQAALGNTAREAAMYNATDTAAMSGPEIMTSEVAASGAAEAGGSSFGGPATFAGNMALNMIPTRDQEKVDTPFGDEGSAQGMLKGTGKGALLGATIGSAVPGVGTAVGAIVGGAAGLMGGAQGYFDSTSPPSIVISRIKQNRGLLGGGGANLYG